MKLKNLVIDIISTHAGFVKVCPFKSSQKAKAEERGLSWYKGVWCKTFKTLIPSSVVEVIDKAEEWYTDQFSKDYKHEAITKLTFYGKSLVNNQ